MPVSIGFPLLGLFVIGLFVCFNHILFGKNFLPIHLGLFPLLAVIGIILKAPWGVSLARFVFVLGYFSAALALLHLSTHTGDWIQRFAWICGVLLGVGLLAITSSLLGSRSAKVYLSSGSLKEI